MTAVDDWLSLLQQSGGVNPTPPAAIAPEPLGWGSGFGLSALASVPGLVGVGPKTTFGEQTGQQILDWQAANPWSAIGADLTGLAVPYGAAFKAGNMALKAVPSVQRWLTGLAESAPIRAAMARETAALVPFEGARLAGAAAFGDEGSLSHVAASAGLDLAVTPLAVGAFKLVGSMLPEADTNVFSKLRKVVPDLDPNRPRQEVLKDLYAMKTAGARPEYSDLLDGAIAAAEKDIRLEGATSRKMAEPFFKGDKETQGALRELFTPASKESKRLIVDPSHFPDEASWRAIAAEVGLSDDWMTALQFPRYVEMGQTVRDVTGKYQASAFTKVRKRMTPAQDGWMITRSADEDMFLIARKLKSEPGAKERWFLGTTNEPEKFIKKDFIQRQNDKIVSFAAKAQERFDAKAYERVLASADDPVLKAAKEYEAAIPPRTMNPLRGKTAAEKALELAESAIPGLRSVSGEFIPRAQKVVEGVKQYVAPAMHQFRDNPLAEWVRNAAQNTYSNAETKANKVLFGVQGLQPGQNVKQRLLSNTQVGGLQKLIAGLADEDMPFVTQILHSPTPMEEIVDALSRLLPTQKARIAPFVEALNKAQTAKWSEMTATRAYAGMSEILPLADRLIPHVWKGDWRQRVSDTLGKTIFMGGGKTREEAKKQADKFVAQNGGKLQGSPFQQGREKDLEEALQIAKQQRVSPEYKLGKGPELKTLRERLDVKGSIGWLEPLTKQELNDIVVSDIKDGYKHIADLIVRKDLGKLVPEIVSRYGTTVGSGLVNRLNSMSGVQGGFSRWQNTQLDKRLGNVLGNNSATKLVSGINEFEAHWNLMGLNLANSAINALTFVQTVAPKLALLKSIPAARWSEFMDIAPAIGSDGLPRGIVQMPSVVKLISMGWKAITKPTEEQAKLISRAMQEGVVAPRFIEEFVGQKSIQAFRTTKGLLQNNSVYEGLKQLSAWLPAKVEEFTRAHAFMIGEIVGRNAGFEGEQLYQFSKQFTQRTMYQYATADRPRIFTGPLGSSFGLFKNWMLHNYADMMQYAGEAGRGNIKPLLWAMSGTGVLGGLGGLPFYGLIDASQKIFTDKTLMEHVYDAFGGVNVASDAAFYGAPSLLGVSLQAQAEGMFANPTRDLNSMYSATVYDRAVKIGKFLNYSWDQYLAGGQSPFTMDRTWDLAAYALGPRSLYKAMAQVEDGSLKAISNGAPIISGVTGLETIRNAFGFTPVQIARAYEANDQIWRDLKRRQDMTADLGEAYMQAMLRQDVKTMQHVLGRTISQGLDVGNVLKSAQTRLLDQARDQLVLDARKDPAAFARLGLFGLL